MARSRARIEARSHCGESASERNDDSESDDDKAAGARSRIESALIDPVRLRESNYLAARDLARNHDLDQFVRSVDTGFGFFVEAPEPSAVPPEAKDDPTGPGQGLVLSGVRSSLWWVLCLTAEQLTNSHLALLAKTLPASWLVELFTELPKRSPEHDATTMLHILVGEPTSQRLISDVLTEPSMTDADVGTLNRLFSGCRALRANAVSESLDLWGVAQ
jgi:hypothetical protein